MFNRYVLALLLTALALALAACAGATEPPKPTAAPTAAPAATSAPSAPTAAPKPAAVSFSKDVLPILQSRCAQCHGARASAGIDLRTYASLQAARIVTPGKASTSKLVEVVVSGAMPKQGPKLTPAEIKTISDWVDAGAPDN